jgi:PBP1b-binding outer membrane lipoprotein LpoB
MSTKIFESVACAVAIAVGSAGLCGCQSTVANVDPNRQDVIQTPGLTPEEGRECISGLMDDMKFKVAVDGKPIVFVKEIGAQTTYIINRAAWTDAICTALSQSGVMSAVKQGGVRPGMDVKFTLETWITEERVTDITGKMWKYTYGVNMKLTDRSTGEEVWTGQKLKSKLVLK